MCVCVCLCVCVCVCAKAVQAWGMRIVSENNCPMHHRRQTMCMLPWQGMFGLGPFDIGKVRYFGIDTASILGAPTPCWRLAAHLLQSFSIGGFGIAFDAFGLPSNRGSNPSLVSSKRLSRNIIVEGCACFYGDFRVAGGRAVKRGKWFTARASHGSRGVCRACPSDMISQSRMVEH